MKLKEGFKDLSASFTIVGKAFSVIKPEIQRIPYTDKKILEDALSRWSSIHSEFLNLSEKFNEVNKSQLSENELIKLWDLDNSVNNHRANLLAEETYYKIHIYPTFISTFYKEAYTALDEMNTLLNNLKEISKILQTIVRNKVSLLEMQRRIESDKKLVSSTNKLLFLTGLLAIIATISILINQLW